ncbi:VanZ family protein [Butyrivibrio sp. XPD2006]
MLIELSQLLFYDRCSDIDDIILNTAGICIGALIYFKATSPRIKKPAKS